MSRSLCIAVVTFAFVSSAYAMNCDFLKSSNVVDQVFHSCPRPFIDKSEQSFCCPTGDGFECCDFYSFILAGSLIIIPIIVVIIIISMIISCICCFCCPFCCIYKRRNVL